MELLTSLDAPSSDVPEVLALRTLKLGDLLVAVPALHAIRRALPEHRLVLAMPAWLDPIIDLVDGVDALLPARGLDDLLPLRSGRIDTAINLHGNGPESRRVIDALGARRRIGHRAQGIDGPEWIDGVNERVRWVRLVEAHGMPGDPDEVWLTHPGPSSRPRAAVVHVGAFYGSRRWPAERFAEVARRLTDDGFDVVLTGGDAERDRALDIARRAGLDDSHALAGRLDLRQFAAVVADARLVVTVDTGAAHLASAFGIPSVVIFGPAPVEEWGPPKGPHIALTDASLRVGDTFGDEPDPALLAVTVRDVLAAAADVLSR